jgi:tripartite-type tricarboxylate transporter receptor subunit TctC
MTLRCSRLALAAAIAATFALVHPPAAPAQDFPTKPIRWVVPFPTGGTNDVIARAVGQELSKAWGQPVVIDNRGGASGTIGTREVAQAAPDGHTILIGTSLTHAANAALFAKLPYDIVRDFQPVTLLSRITHVLVVPAKSPYRSVKELVDAARAQPGKLSFGSSSPGSAAQVIGELLKLRAGVDMTHVPYKGIAQQVSDLAGGHLTFSFSTLGGVRGQIEGGTLRVLAVDADTRLAALPNVPTMKESGAIQDPVPAWFGLFVPAGTPRPIVDRYSAEMRRILAAPETRTRLEQAGFEVATMSVEEFGGFVRREIDRWGEVIRKAGVRVD